MNKLLNKAIQTKYIEGQIRTTDYIVSSVNLDAFVPFSAAITSTRELYAVIPQLSEGTGQQNRVGDEISPTKAFIKLNITPQSWEDAGSYDFTAHIFLISSKSVKFEENLSAVPIQLLLDNGAGGGAPFNGDNLVALHKINTEAFTVHKYKKLRLVKGIGLTQGTLGSGQVCPQRPQWNQLTMKVPLPKKLKYVTNAQTYPSNAAPFLCIGFTRNDTNPTVPSNYGISVQGRCYMYYKDA